MPPRAAWWVSTVEAMPVDIGADFLAVDEIQLCGDPDRGHIFTDRLLNARGLQETLFLGAETMRARIASLVPGPQLIQRERFSRLSYTGPRKISRMPPRSAVVGFSVEEVYAIAELIRRQKGGAAVVMGALSPRTRNAQVALYQNGDVDYLVATDAIGMGLNLDIAHVAFSGLVKFDGRRHRHLSPSELAQIAGRAGRYTSDGTFGVTGDAPPLDQEVVDAIENHRFRPLARLQWRNSALDFSSPEALVGQPRSAGRPSRPAAGAGGGRPRDAQGAVRHPRGARPAARTAGHPAPLGRLPDPRLPQGDARRARQPLRAHLPLPAGRRRHPHRLACAADFAHRSNRRRHRRVVQAAGLHPHVDLRRAAPRLGGRRGPLARRDPCGRRPAVGCAARAADAAFRGPAHLGPDARVEAEGEPFGHSDGERRGPGRGPVHRPARGLPLSARPHRRRRPGPHAPRRRPCGAGAGPEPPGGQVLQRPRHRDRRHRAGRADVGRVRRRQARRRPRRAQPANPAVCGRGCRPRGRREGSPPPRALGGSPDRRALPAADRAAGTTRR